MLAFIDFPFHRGVTKVLYDAIVDRFSRMEMVVACEMVPADRFLSDTFGFLANIFFRFLLKNVLYLFERFCIFSDGDGGRLRDGGGLRRAGTICAARHQWAREAGELPWVSRHSVGRETGVTIKSWES